MHETGLWRLGIRHWGLEIGFHPIPNLQSLIRYFMNSIFLPTLLAIGGLITAFATYRGIRRGGARFYTLEREAILRRASFMLFISTLLFSGAVGLLLYDRQQSVEATAVDTTETDQGNAPPTATVPLEQFPPTETPTPDLDPIPTATATAVLCRAIVDGTGGNGLTLRTVPGGDEITILPDGSTLIVLDDAPTESGGINWRNARIIGGDEGWVAEDFLTLRSPCK